MLLVLLGNAEKLGNKEAGDFFTNDKIVVLTGTIVMPAANADDLTGYVEVNYPSGFTRDNCVILSLMSHNQNTKYKDYWTLATSNNDSMQILFGSNCSAILKDSKIRISSNKASASLARNDITYKLVLMRID